MKKSMTVLAAIFLVAVMSSDLFALGHGPGRGPGAGPGFGACYDGSGPGARGLNLTPEQDKKMNELREAQLKNIAPLRDKMFAKRDELKLLWLQANPDREKINAAQAEMRTLRDKMQDQMTSARLDMLNLLTPEQRVKFQAAGARGYGPGPYAGEQCGDRRGMMRSGWYGGHGRGMMGNY